MSSEEIFCVCAANAFRRPLHYIFVRILIGVGGGVRGLGIAWARDTLSTALCPLGFVINCFLVHLGHVGTRWRDYFVIRRLLYRVSSQGRPAGNEYQNLSGALHVACLPSFSTGADRSSIHINPWTRQVDRTLVEVANMRPFRYKH